MLPVLEGSVGKAASDPVEELEALRRELLEDAFRHDQRGEPAAAEAVLVVAGRLADLQSTWRARTRSGEWGVVIRQTAGAS